MSLHDAVMDIADRMEAAAGDDRHGGLVQFALELRIALRAAGSPVSAPPLRAELPLDELAFHRVQIEAVKRGVRSAEREAQRAVEVQGGAVAGIIATIAGDMPVGALTVLGMEVYVLQADGVLHYEREETLKYRAQLARGQVRQ